MRVSAGHVSPRLWSSHEVQCQSCLKQQCERVTHRAGPEVPPANGSNGSAKAHGAEELRRAGLGELLFLLPSVASREVPAAAQFALLRSCTPARPDQVAAHRGPLPLHRPWWRRCCKTGRPAGRRLASCTFPVTAALCRASRRLRCWCWSRSRCRSRWRWRSPPWCATTCACSGAGGPRSSGTACRAPSCGPRGEARRSSAVRAGSTACRTANPRCVQCVLLGGAQALTRQCVLMQGPRAPRGCMCAASCTAPAGA